MKCTYRVLILVGTTVCVLLMLGINGDLSKFIHERGTTHPVSTSAELIKLDEDARHGKKSLSPLNSSVTASSSAAKNTDEAHSRPPLTSQVHHTSILENSVQLDPSTQTYNVRISVSKAATDVITESKHKQVKHFQGAKPSNRMVLAVVCCGDRVNETRTMLKSAAALSYTSLTMVVFTEDSVKHLFREMHASWPDDVQQRIKLDLYSISFPPGQDAAAWRKLFKPCASQRLFMPSLLKDIDSLVYVDTDVLFLAPLEEIWKHFQAMNSSQMAAMAPEHEDLATGWYNRFAKHPYYGKLGVNSGVMLMNLTRLRKFGWEEYVVPIYKHYKLAITWGDQDIINIIFHYHPDKLHVFGCEYNLRPDHCMYMSVCKVAEKRGVYVLHGNRGTFHSDKQPAFRAVYKAWEEYQLGEDLRQDLYYPMQRYLLKALNTTCGKIYNAFLKVLGTRVRLR